MRRAQTGDQPLVCSASLEDPVPFTLLLVTPTVSRYSSPAFASRGSKAESEVALPFPTQVTAEDPVSTLQSFGLEKSPFYYSISEKYLPIWSPLLTFQFECGTWARGMSGLWMETLSSFTK